MSRRWILPAVLLVLLFTASLISVQPGTVGVLRGVGGGRAFVLDRGLHFRIPFLQRLQIYPDGLLKLDFPWDVVSHEGAQVKLQVHFEGLVLRETLLQFSERAGPLNAPTLIRDDLGDWIRTWASTKSVKEIALHPTDLAPQFREAARTGGFQIKSLVVSRESNGPPGPTALPLPAPAPGKQRVKVVILGLDGADWQILDPLIEAGKAPTLGRLKHDGAWASLRSMDPMLSPMLWTTAATGKPPEEHGVIDFLVRDPKTGRQAPVSAAARRVKALWNLFTESGLSSDVVAWWATWPAERIKGTLVSDRVAYSLFSTEAGPQLSGAVSPESYAAEIAKLKVSDRSVSAEDLRPFVDIKGPELEELRKRGVSDPKVAARDPVLHLTRILAGTRTYQAISLDLLTRGQPDLFALYYQGIDEVSHRFAHFADPKMAMVSEADHRRFRRAVEAFYVYQDRLLGEVLSRLDPGSLVLVFSDHGFKSGASRPRDHPPDIEGQPARWHRPYGIFLASGKMVAPGEKETFSLLEVAPTVLAAAGLPPAKDMPGALRADLFIPSFAAKLPSERIATYERGHPAREAETASPENEASSKAAEAMKENLHSLGYIGGGDGQNSAPGTAYAHANLAGIHLQNGKLAEAEREAKEALRIVPGYLPALIYLAEVYEREKRYAEALPLARQAATSDSPEWQSGIYLLLANLYVSLGKPQQGITDLSTFLAGHGNESDLHSALGIVKAAAGDASGSEQEYRLAYNLNPQAQEPVRQLFDLYKKQGQIHRLLPLLQAAAKNSPESAFHANYLGLAFDQTGRIQEAETSYRRALQIDPEHPGALVNLGGLLARQRRVDEAMPLFKRALARDPQSVEARVGLGAALSIRGKNDEAIATLQEGEKLGLASPALYNALAMAYFQGRHKEKAIGSLKASLKLDPAQASARSLLAEWEKR